MSNASVLLPEPDTPVIDAELAARDADVERLQVVLARVDDADHSSLTRALVARLLHEALQRPPFLHALAVEPSARS
jgi:hypothetical protein